MPWASVLLAGAWVWCGAQCTGAVRKPLPCLFPTRSCHGPPRCPPNPRQANGEWSLFCPNEAPGLADCWGEEFNELYARYEREGR